MTQPHFSEHMGQEQFKEVAALDPELLAQPETRKLVEIGYQFIDRVSQKHGNPDNPQWFAGTREATFMAYHNGQSATSFGHTSVGEAGVTRNFLEISHAINQRAGQEVVDATERALGFSSMSAHDDEQLHGRSIDFTDGDEIRSAKNLYEALEHAGFPQDVCEEASLRVMATLFNPRTLSQTIDYERPQISVLGQEIAACSDLLSIVLPRGPKGGLENIMEGLGMSAQDHALQKALLSAGIGAEQITTPEDMMTFIEITPSLKERFIAGLNGQVWFVSNFVFSDRTIRQVCGAGIDQLFPGRARNIEVSKNLASQAQDGVSLTDIWQQVSTR